MTKVSSIDARRIAGIFFPLVLCTQAALASDEPEDCAAIQSPDERLACFDAAYGSAAAEPLTPESTVVDSDEAASAAGVVGPAAAAATQPATPSEADFGLNKSKDETEGESLTSGIAAVGKDGYGKLWFELDNGQLWRQTEYKRFPAKSGQVAEIRHGSFGSYKLYIKGEKRWTRVRRAE